MSKIPKRTEGDDLEWAVGMRKDHDIQTKVCIEQRDELKRLREYIVQLLDSNLNLSGQLRIALQRVEPALEHNKRQFAGSLAADEQGYGHVSPSGKYRWNSVDGWHGAKEGV